MKQKLFLTAMCIALLGLQHRLWVGEGSFAHRAELQQKIHEQIAANDILRERNRLLSLEVEALKQGSVAVEERAREQMGMIREGETLFMLIDTHSMVE